KNGLIYLYSHDDFERTAVLDIHEELAKGAHSYAIETLVTQQTGIIKPYIRNSILLSLLIIFAVIGLAGGIYFVNVRPILHSVPVKEEKSVNLKSFVVTKMRTLQPKVRLLIACILSVV
ncbi:MAG: hypothetical protein ACFFDT_40185, partial [Candidatus Hodarchaeota archaeon]